MSDGPLRTGQQFDPRDNFTVGYTEQTLDYSESTGLTGAESNSSTEIQVKDRKAATVRVYTPPTTVLAAIQYIFPTTRDLSPLFPDVLSSITVVFAKSTGAGSTEFPLGNTGTIAIGSSGSFGINLRANSSGSAAISGDVAVNITPTYATNAPVTNISFLLPEGSTNLAQVLGKASRLLAVSLGTEHAVSFDTVTFFVTWTGHTFSNNDPVSFYAADAVAVLPLNVQADFIYYVTQAAANVFKISRTPGASPILLGGSPTGNTYGAVGIKQWPVFRPRAHTIILTGEQISVSANAASNDRLSFSDSSASGEYAYGGGTSAEVGVNVRTIRVSPTIHGALTLSPLSDSATAHAFADAPLVELWGTTGHIEERDNDFTANEVANGAVTIDGGSTISATSPSSIPTSGYYLIEPHVNPSVKWGYSSVLVELFDFSYFA